MVGGGAGAKRLDERMKVRRGRVMAVESDRRKGRESALRLSLQRRT